MHNLNLKKKPLWNMFLTKTASANIWTYLLSPGSVGGQIILIAVILQLVEKCIIFIETYIRTKIINNKCTLILIETQCYKNIHEDGRCVS